MKLNDVNWRKKYNELREFQCREGHCNVQRRFNENKSLGTWVSSQRAQYKKMRAGKPSHMTEQRIEALEEIGFLWSVNDPNDAWYKKYVELKQFKCREGHCNVPQHFSQNKSLGKWVHYQRAQYKKIIAGKRSSMTQLRIQELNDIGFQWSIKDPNDKAWYKKYVELKQFKCREGHCNVPYHFSENKSLGMWVSTQRTQYKKMIEGKSSSLTQLKIQELNDIGFQWSINDPSDKAWYKKYVELKQFKCREGHCNVSVNFSENRSLGMWVSSQRALYKKMIEGKSSSLTQLRIQELNDIGFLWSFYNTTAMPETPSPSLIKSNSSVT